MEADVPSPEKMLINLISKEELRRILRELHGVNKGRINRIGMIDAIYCSANFHLSMIESIEDFCFFIQDRKEIAIKILERHSKEDIMEFWMRISEYDGFSVIYNANEIKSEIKSEIERILNGL